MERKSAVLFKNCPFEENSTKIEKAKISEPKESKESMLSVQDQLDNLLKGFDYFSVGYKYAQDMYNETTLTIHQEKAKCKKAVKDNTYLQKGLQEIINVIFGDKPRIESQNEVLKNYAKKWNRFSNYIKEVKQGCTQAVATGDGYVRKIKGDKGSFRYQNIENAEDIYIDWDFEENRPKRYIERVYYQEARTKGIKAPEYKNYTLQTPLGTETIRGIEYSPDEIMHIKFGENVWGIYGRGAPASALDDIDILNQMERSAAIIARYKAVPKKMIFPDTTNNDEVMDDKAVQKIKKVLQEMRDYESPVVGAKFASLNLTDGGQALDLTPYFDYFKRKVSIVMSPEFIVHGELVNRSTGVEQKQMFYLDVCSIRSDFENTIQDNLTEGLNASIKILENQGVQVPKAVYWFEFGDYDVELREDKNSRLMNEWLNGVICLNEYRKTMGYPEDEEYGIAYRWEIANTNESQLSETIKKITNEKLPKR